MGRMVARRRRRRTKAEIQALRAALVHLAVKHRPVSVRQLFYLAVSDGLIAKTEKEYQNTVIWLLAEARLSGALPWSAVVDHTRSSHRPYTFTGVKDAIEDTARTYRRNMWRSADVRVEIWCEKETLVGVLRPVTFEYDIGLFPTRGYPSLSFLYDCAEDIDIADKPTKVFYFGDRDPSGLDIERNVAKRLREFAADADITFTRLAVTREQVDDLDLQTRPTKQTDSRARGFEGESVEVEAIQPAHLRAMCRAAIEAHIDPDDWDRLKLEEEAGKQFLEMFPWHDIPDVPAGLL